MFGCPYPLMVFTVFFLLYSWYISHTPDPMFESITVFPPRHNDSEIIDGVARFWEQRGFQLRQPYNNCAKGWNLKGPFHLVDTESGLVGRHFWGYEDLMDHTNEMARYAATY